MKTLVNKMLLGFAAVVLFNSIAISQGANNIQPTNTPLADSVFFNSLITQYTESINKADTVLALKIWSPRVLILAL